MRAQADARVLYNVTVSGLTSTLPGPGDIVKMYCDMRATYPRDISVEIRPVADSYHISNKVDWHHGDH